MSVHYQPARLVKGVSWYILYYQLDPNTGKKARHRESHDLNRIKDKKEKLKKAKEMVAYINSVLPLGYPHENYDYIDLRITPVSDAIDMARDIKCQSDRKGTTKSYSTAARIFILFLDQKQMKELPVQAVDKSIALSFLDYLISVRKVQNSTRNNYLVYMQGLFGVLEDRKYIQSNPFKGIPHKKESQKARRHFTNHDAKVIINHLLEHDKELLLGVLLLYHCFIRPAELRRMRIHMISLRRGLINLPGQITKNKRTQSVTIPDVLKPFLAEFNFHRMDQFMYIFGPGLKPNKEKQCGRDSMTKRHKRIIDKLYSNGKISTTNGLSLYSWKDTGAMHLVELGIDIEQIRKQLRHSSLEETQRYLQSFGIVNEGIKTKSKSLLGSYSLD